MRRTGSPRAPHRGVLLFPIAHPVQPAHLCISELSPRPEPRPLLAWRPVVVSKHILDTTRGTECIEAETCPWHSGHLGLLGSWGYRREACKFWRGRVRLSLFAGGDPEALCEAQHPAELWGLTQTSLSRATCQLQTFHCPQPVPQTNTTSPSTAWFVGSVDSVKA